MGEDQDAAGARGLDEAHRGDGLAGAGRVLEPEALGGVGIVGRAPSTGVLVDVLGGRRPSPRAPRRARPLLVVLVLAAGSPRRGAARRGSSAVDRSRCPTPSAEPFAVPLAVALGLGQQRGQRARERVDLVGVEQRAVGEVRLVLAKQALEPEQQRHSRRHCDRRVPRRRRRSRPAPRRARARRGEPGASASAGSRPRGRSGSRVKRSARSMSAGSGTGAASTAAAVGSAMEQARESGRGAATTLPGPERAAVRGAGGRGCLDPRGVTAYSAQSSASLPA